MSEPVMIFIAGIILGATGMNVIHMIIQDKDSN